MRSLSASQRNVGGAGRVLVDVSAMSDQLRAFIRDISAEAGELTPGRIPTMFELAQEAQQLSFRDLTDEYEHFFEHGYSSYIGSTLADCGFDFYDVGFLIAHSGRELFHGSMDRKFARAFYKSLCDECQRACQRDNKTYSKQPQCKESSCGKTTPKLYPLEKLSRLQYIVLNYPQIMPFLLVDVDLCGTSGGSVTHIHPHVFALLNRMNEHGFTPNWLGVNPLSGKCQLIWYIDTVFTDGKRKKNKPVKYLKALTRDMTLLLGGDPAFSHRFMRNPLYVDSREDLGSYRWNCFHNEIFPMKALAKEIERMGGTITTRTDSTSQGKTYEKTGWELIEQAKKNREQATQWRTYAQELSGLSIEELEHNDPDLISGVRIIWLTNGVPARNETAFRHALKIATRLRKKGERLSDAAIIDAFMHAYHICLEVDTSHRAAEYPAQRELQQLAARIRGYATRHNSHTRSGGGISSSYNYTTPHEKRVLSIFGQRGGKESAARKWAQPDSLQAQKVLNGLERANTQRKRDAKARSMKAITYLAQQIAETGTLPTRREIMSEFNVSEATAKRYLRQAKTLLTD